ncbi:Asr1405/Asl0597 family protein [Phormidesmis priestleyi]
MNLDSTPSSTTLTIDVKCCHRWQIYHRLRELEIPCSCVAYQPLMVQVDSAIAIIQLWSVMRQITTPRQKLADWLEDCWRW